MKRRGARALLNGSLGAMIVCLVRYCGASLPYPDPAPELLAKQSEQLQFWGRWLLVWLGVVAASAVLLLVLRRRERRRKGEE